MIGHARMQEYMYVCSKIDGPSFHTGVLFPLQNIIVYKNEINVINPTFQIQIASRMTTIICCPRCHYNFKKEPPMLPLFGDGKFHMDLKQAGNPLGPGCPIPKNVPIKKFAFNYLGVAPYLCYNN